MNQTDAIEKRGKMCPAGRTQPYCMQAARTAPFEMPPTEST